MKEGERQPMLMVVTGHPKVGKSYRTLQELLALKEKGRNILIFDTNLEGTFAQFPTIDFDVEAEREQDRAKWVRQFRPVPGRPAEIRRVVPFTKSGQPMSLDQKATTCYDLMKFFEDGCLLLEDVNNYLTAAATKHFVSSICTFRHRRQDVIIHLQATSAIPPRLWQNVTYLRMHHESTSVDRIKTRLPNYQLNKLAELLINRAYNAGSVFTCLYLDIQHNKILTKEPFFRQAVQDYFMQFPRELDRIAGQRDLEGKKLYANRQQALEEETKRLIADYLPAPAVSPKAGKQVSITSKKRRKAS
ncbi:hypothetical protein SAMN05421823_11943 [Catalinimonas alkaloidigena]|uniref:Uncharacterized protein n=1 Tax=Catalinimonas alkaloidigena TaxID=1075417 RepID=A0A1G9V7X4_9BACT|nr:hypothetical protein [Catalinimonas alkaloidigena]SDM68190.1 hypothetical protein SAMN05421823_11943 [Catalinimonas alkaloidigena]